MPTLQDQMARSAAAEDVFGGGLPNQTTAEAGVPEIEGAGGEMPAAARIDAALSEIEGALESVPPDKQERIRSLVNSIRDVTADIGVEAEAQGGALAAPPVAEAPLWFVARP